MTLRHGGPTHLSATDMAPRRSVSRAAEHPPHRACGPDEVTLGRRSLRLTRALRIPGETAVVGRVVYATITLMSVLIIYDGWEDLRVIDVVGVIFGPILAMFIAHVFSASLAMQVTEGRRLRWAERVAIMRTESRFLLLAVPPLALLAVTHLAGASLKWSINIIVWAGAASLGYWGYVAGRRAGLKRWRLVGAVAGGLLVGLVILVLQVLLQPGKVFSGGEL